jgi:hypothetical protein
MKFRPCSKRNILVFASLALLASLLFVSSAWAIETRGGQNVTIGADEVIEDDLYVGAETVTVEGTVRGDLVAAGGTVRMNGTVEGDIISAGQTVSLAARRPPPACHSHRGPRCPGGRTLR